MVRNLVRNAVCERFCVVDKVTLKKPFGVKCGGNRIKEVTQPVGNRLRGKHFWQ